ncbi:MAG: hypothetical protein JOZ08_10155 [Verrucomicrobia bacterium]|nr:hypothetical protein [Verrucomicrobiota bacterium]
MTLIRELFRRLLGILEHFTEEDAWVLLCAAGVSYFLPEGLSPKDEGNEEAVGAQGVSLSDALCLEAECPVWSGKSRTLSASFVWRKESDLNVRDWIYLG